MSALRFTPCDCGETNYRLRPRRWWMRLLPSFKRYHCKSCGATLLLRRDHGLRRPRGRGWLIVLGIVLAVIVSFVIVGYREEWSYSAQKRAAESE